MSEQTVATRYAKSLIGLAQEKGVLDAVAQDMELFDRVCDENRELPLMLKSPIVKHWKKLNILSAIFRDKVSPVTYAVFEIITKKNREAILHSVADEFHKQYKTFKNIVSATVTTATPLTDDQRQEIMALVGGETKKEVELTEKINEKLIGGYVLRVGDRQIDTSVSRSLNDLKVKFA